MIDIQHLTFTHAGAETPTLVDVDLTVNEGDLCLVAGRTGTGKSTLLGTINGSVPHLSGGTLQGRVVVAGRDTGSHRPRDLADVVGMVGQNPLHGFVTDTVEDEIAYGMEQLGLSPAAMRTRVEETLDLMGIADLRRRPLVGFSGGQQQRVAIASVLAAQPSVLVLDEPTSALDPAAAADVLAAITTLVHEVGLTVVLAEHRLERVMHAADSMLWLDGSGHVHQGAPEDVLAVADVVPPLGALARRLGWTRVPTSVRAAQRRVRQERLTAAEPLDHPSRAGEAVLEVERLSVRYGDQLAVHDVSLHLGRGSITALMGRNGAGKSSLLWAVQGGVPSTGRVTVQGRDPRRLGPSEARHLISLVPQSAADLLYLPTVADECAQSDRESAAPPGTTEALLGELGVPLAPGADPRRLSEGQRLALVLAIQLCADPVVLLLDEPTRGLDYAAKAALQRIVQALAGRGTAVLVSTHDVEFAAAVSERIVVLGDGEVVADGATRQICTSSAVFAPQLAKVFAPVPVLTIDELTPLRVEA